MTKKIKLFNHKMIIGIFLVILLCSVAFLYYKNTNNSSFKNNISSNSSDNYFFKNDTSFKKVITNEDFEIINISWNKYNTQFIMNPEGGYSPSELKYSPIDWEHYCKNCGKTEGVNCTQSAYLIYTNQTKDLNCIIYYNGFQKTDYPEDIRWLFRKGIDVVGIGLESLDIRKDNEIKICCISENSNEVCKEIILKKAC